jgi:hypothetical protein
MNIDSGESREGNLLDELPNLKKRWLKEENNAKWI